VAIEAARERAAELGRPRAAPPYPLSRCDRGTLSQALASPRASWEGEDFYPTLVRKAAVLLYSLAKSQACPEGNKRVALILLNEFLAMNGVDLNAEQSDLRDMILRAAESDRQARDRVIDELEQWLSTVIVPIPEEGP
jgi:death on curing protein